MPFPIPVSRSWRSVARSLVKERTRKVTAFSRTFNNTLATICAKRKICHICVESTSKCNIKENVRRTLSLELKVHTRCGFLRYHTCPSDPEAACKKHFLYAFFIPEKPVNPALIRLNLWYSVFNLCIVGRPNHTQPYTHRYLRMPGSLTTCSTV